MFGGMLAAAACDSSTPPTQPTQPTTPGSTSVTQVLTGTIAAGVTPFHSFTVPSGAPLHMMLGSLTSPAEVPLGSTVTLVYGVPATDGVTCKPLAKVSTTAGLKAQFNVLASAGEYCLAMENVGSVPEGSLYAMRVIYGTPNEDTSAGILIVEMNPAESNACRSSMIPSICFSSARSGLARLCGASASAFIR